MTVRRLVTREMSGFAGALACLAALCAAPLPAVAQSCNFTDAPAGLTGVVNTYYPGTGTPAAVGERRHRRYRGHQGRDRHSDRRGRPVARDPGPGR